MVTSITPRPNPLSMFLKPGISICSTEGVVAQIVLEMDYRDWQVGDIEVEFALLDIVPPLDYVYKIKGQGFEMEFGTGVNSGNYYCLELVKLVTPFCEMSFEGRDVVFTSTATKKSGRLSQSELQQSVPKKKLRDVDKWLESTVLGYIQRFPVNWSRDASRYFTKRKASG